MTYREGDHFGDSDTLLGLPRDCKATSEVRCTLYMITKEQFEDLLKEYPDL